MNIAPDPKSDSIDSSDGDFDAAFAEFAAGNKDPAPSSDEDNKDDAPDGNGPDDDAAAPADEGEKPEAAADEQKEPDAATSGEAEADGGGQPPADEHKEAPDPWAALPPELKAQVDQLQKERDEAAHRAASDANRVAALSRKLRELSAGQSGAGTPPAPEQPTEAQKALDAKIKQLREDYGDIAEPLIELIDAQRKELTNVRATLDGLSVAQQQQVVAQETQALEARHPDWREIAQSPDFVGWLEVQPTNIQRLAQSWDARETSVALTLFKAERAETTGQKPTEEKPAAPAAAEAPKPKPNAATDERRSQQLDGGRDVRSKPVPAASGAPDDFDAAFNYFTQKKQLASQRR